MVSSVGYVAVNDALLSKMKIRHLVRSRQVKAKGTGRGRHSRIEERGNEEADYVSVAPSSCPVGAELSVVPYINQHLGRSMRAQLKEPFLESVVRVCSGSETRR